MHSRVGRQRQASQNSGTVIAASGGRVVARDVLNSVSGCSRPIFSSERCPPGNRRPRCRQRRPAHGGALDALPRSSSVAPDFFSPRRGRVRRRPHSGALELRCSGFRPGSAASRRIFLPRMLPRLPSRRVPFSLSAAPGRRWSSDCRRPTASRRRCPNHIRGVFPHGRAARASPPVPPTAALVMSAPPDFVAQ